MTSSCHHLNSQVGLATTPMIMIVTNAVTTTAIQNRHLSKSDAEAVTEEQQQSAVAEEQQQQSTRQTEENIQTLLCQIGNELAEECDDNKV